MFHFSHKGKIIAPLWHPGHDSGTCRPARCQRGWFRWRRLILCPANTNQKSVTGMSSSPLMDPKVRETIMADPAVLLDDKDIMRVLVAANERAMGPNIVDLRGIAMDRLEARLDRLEDTHRSVIAAAYDNVAGMNQIHRAVLRMWEAERFETLLRDLGGDVAAILRVDSLRLVIESDHADGEDGIERLDSVLVMEPRGFVDTYLRAGRGGRARDVVLRPVDYATVHRDDILSEACLRLDLGEDLGMLVLGSADERHFHPQHGTDLLSFLRGATERALRRFLG